MNTLELNKAVTENLAKEQEVELRIAMARQGITDLEAEREDIRLLRARLFAQFAAEELAKDELSKEGA